MRHPSQEHLYEMQKLREGESQPIDYKALADELGRALEGLPFIAIENDWPSEVRAARVALAKWKAAQGQRG